MLLFIGCKKTDVVVASVPDIVGQTFSAYVLTSSLDGSKVYAGYRFTSTSSALELVLDENARVITQKVVSYSGVYPSFKIEGSNAAGGFWDAVFLSSSVLQVKSLLMKKL